MGERLDAFHTARNWMVAEPGDLAKSVVLEAAELLEHFQWDDMFLAQGKPTPERDPEKIRGEVADVLIYLFSFCRTMNIDLAEAMLEKMEKLNLKYPPRKISYEEHMEFKKKHRQKS